MELTGHAEPDHRDGITREYLDLPLRVQARRQNLDHRSGAIVDRVGKPEHLARRYHQVFGEAAVDIAADQRAVRAEIGLANAAMEAGAAVGFGIDHHAITDDEGG